MNNKDLIAIFEYLEREKGIKRQIVIDAIADSLRAAARKSVKGLGDKVSVEINPKSTSTPRKKSSKKYWMRPKKFL